MKRIRFFSIMLLIIPCAVVFASCGGGVNVKSGTYKPTYFSVDGHLIAIEGCECFYAEMNGLQLTEIQKTGLFYEFKNLVASNDFMSSYIKISDKNIEISSFGNFNGASNMSYQMSGPFGVKSNGRLTVIGVDFVLTYKNGKIYESRKVTESEYDVETSEVVITTIAEYKVVYAK